MRDKRRAVLLALGRNVRQLRELRGMSQERLAEVTERTAKYIGQVERGEISPAIDKLLRIAEGLSVGIAQLAPSPGEKTTAAPYPFTRRELDQIAQGYRLLMRATRRGPRATRGAGDPPAKS